MHDGRQTAQGRLNDKNDIILQENTLGNKLRAGVESLFWPPHSRLFIKGDRVNWSLYWDAVELAEICRKLGIQVVENGSKRLMKNQCLFNMSRYEILENWKKPRYRIAFPYYHGNPETDEGSRRMLETISRHHAAIDRIQVSCRFMEAVVKDTGIDPSKVFRIPIGINRRYFPATDEAAKASARKKLGIPASAVVAGSFQKDGEGWQEGLTPKLIKGPDIFLETVGMLKRSVPELHVLLTGPARGYVRRGLEELHIPFVHRHLDDYTEIGTYYQALDLYIVSSRDEGGPKAVLESMACGVPLVSTKVGQATDLVRHGENGFLVDVGDAEALAHCSLQVLHDSSLRANVIQNGLATAEANDYRNQLPLWADFMKGFVSC